SPMAPDGTIGKDTKEGEGYEGARSNAGAATDRDWRDDGRSRALRRSHGVARGARDLAHFPCVAAAGRAAAEDAVRAGHAAGAGRAPPGRVRDARPERRSSGRAAVGDLPARQRLDHCQPPQHPALRGADPAWRQRAGAGIPRLRRRRRRADRAGDRDRRADGLRLPAPRAARRSAAHHYLWLVAGLGRRRGSRVPRTGRGGRARGRAGFDRRHRAAAVSVLPHPPADPQSVRVDQQDRSHRLAGALPAQPGGRGGPLRRGTPPVRRGAAAEAVRRGQRRPRLRLRARSAVLPRHPEIPGGPAPAPVSAEDDPHKCLRDDVSLLGEMLGTTLRTREGHAVFETVEQVRRAAKAAREGAGHETVPLERRLRPLPLDVAVPVARAFSHFLTLANIAEQHHRIRRRREYLRVAGSRPQPGSFDEVLPRLLGGGTSRDRLADAVTALHVELVLTAHPTAITRRTLAEKHRRIADALARRDRADVTAPEREQALADL